MLQPGQIFAKRYRVEARIAQGGMGAIYAAEHLSTEERVALKVLWPQVLGSKAAVENFQLEARIAARLGGEHIVRILDAGFDEAGGLPYLAMELLQGQTLDALVTSRGPLKPAEALWVMRQVAKALDRAHGYVDRKGRPAPIVHRDLKPENLFLAATEGGAATIKVLDFGVAKVLSQSHHLSRELRGTPLFMANEQIESGVVTPQLDVWALGLIAYYLLAGRHYWLAASQPYVGFGPLFHEILQKPLEAPSDRLRAQGLTPPWPPAFDAWFLHCVHRNAAERLFPAGTAIEALAVALGVDEGRPVDMPRANVTAPPEAPAAPAGPGGVSAPRPTPEPHAGGVTALLGPSPFQGADSPAADIPAAGVPSADRLAAVDASTSAPSADIPPGGNVAQTVHLPRSGQSAVGRRRRGVVAAAVAVTATALATFVSYHYLTARALRGEERGALLSGAPSSPEISAERAPPADASPRSSGGEPSPSAAVPAGSAGASASSATPEAPPDSRTAGAKPEGSQEPGTAAAARPEARPGRENRRRQPPRSKAPNTNVAKPDPYEFRGD